MATEEDREFAYAIAEYVLATGGSKEAIKRRLADYKAERDRGRTAREILGLAETSAKTDG